MKSLRNSIQLIGNLGNEVEVIEFDNGKKLAKFRLATNDFYKNNKGEKVQETQWHNIVAWGKTAEFINNSLKKGNQVALKGKLTHRTYEDKEGITRYQTEVVVDEFFKITKEDLPF